MPKNKYLIEREAFDCEREIHYRRRFKGLMKSILRNQNRKFKLLLVIGYFKLLSNTLLISKSIQTSGKPQNYHQRGEADSIRRNLLYAMKKPLVQEFPYNMPPSTSPARRSLSSRPNWSPDDGSQILSKEEMIEIKMSKDKSEETRKYQKTKRNHKRLASIPELRNSLQKVPISGEDSNTKMNREEALKRNLLVAETLPSKSIEGRKRKSIVLPAGPTVPEILTNMCSIYSTFRQRTQYKYLLRWMRKCRAKEESEYLKEIENVNIVLTERTFRERMFRTKVKLMQEAIETQIRNFEEQVKSHS